MRWPCMYVEYAIASLKSASVRAVAGAGVPSAAPRRCAEVMPTFYHECKNILHNLVRVPPPA